MTKPEAIKEIEDMISGVQARLKKAYVADISQISSHLSSLEKVLQIIKDIS